MTQQEIDQTGEAVEMNDSGAWETLDGFQIKPDGFGLDILTPGDEPVWFAYADTFPVAVDKIKKERRERLFH